MVLNTTVGELIEKEDAPEAMVWALKEQIEELMGELNIYKVALENGVLVVAPKPKVDVSKPKEFNGTRFTNNMNFLRGIEQYFYAKGITYDATNLNITAMHLLILLCYSGTVDPQMKDNVVLLLGLRRRSIVKSRGSFTQSMLRMRLGLSCVSLRNNAQSWAKQELQHRVKELSKAMIVDKSLFELFLRKNKIESCEPKEKDGGGGDE
ncbi:hypothetical protein CXB51_024381 [Gossypium anomalum]|uniref:Uncharacterized protein n=1 Tax=Gossypium anomalum TaxID=47600 RepID=A0A8J5Z6J1_9ROSI|nr:hypothetical protein CXB51_024381 [Gossypium anomalum]